MAHLEKEAHRNIFHRTLSHNITDIITEENSLKEDSQNKMIRIPMKIIKLQKSKNAYAYELIPERVKLVPNAIEENKDSITNTPSIPLPIRQKKIPCYTPKTDIVEDETVTTRLDQLKEKKAIKNYIERLDLLNKEDIHQDKGIKTSPKRQHNYMSYSLDRRDTLYSLTQKLEGSNYYNSNILNEKNDRNNNDKPKTNTILNESLDTTKYCLQDKLTTMMKYKKKSKPNSVLVFDKRTLLNDINNRHHQEKKIEIISIMNNSQRKIEDNDNDSQFDLFSFVEEKEKEKKSSMKTRNTNQTKYNAEDNSNNSEINIKYNGCNYKTNSINYLHSFEIIQEEKEEENPNNFNPQSISDIRNCSYDRKHIDSLQINGLTKRENTKPLFYSGLQIDNTTNKMTLSKKENINSKSNEVKYSLFGNDSSAKQRHQNRNSILKCALSNNFTIASDNNSFISRENSYSHLPSNNYYNISHDQSYNNTDQTHLFESKRINESYSASQYQYDIMNKRHNIQLIFERKKNKNKYIINDSPIFSPSPSLSNMRGIESTPDYTNYRGFSYEGINGQNYGNDSIDQYPLFIDSYCNNLKLKNSSMKRNCIIAPLHLSITNIPLTNTYQDQKSYQERFNDYNPIVYYQKNNTPENKIQLLNEMISHHQHNKNKMKKNNVTKIININRKYLCQSCESECRPLLYHYHT